MIVRRFLMPLTLLAMTALCVEALAQSAFPAPLPNRSGEAPAAIYPPPSVNITPQQQDVFSQGAAPLGSGLAGSGGQGSGGASSADRQECMEGFMPLRQDAEKKAAAIKAALARKAAPQETCGLITSYVEAEAQLVSYVTTRQTACGIPAAIQEQLKANQARSNEMMRAVCAAANHRSPGDQFPLPPGQPPDTAPTRNWGDDIFIRRLMERQEHGR